MATKRYRLDHLLVEQGLAPSGAKAQALILAGAVLVNGERVDKPGRRFEDSISITLKDKGNKFVSRGGLKLEGALNAIGLEVAGMVALDVGSSTGGFTDCLLQRSAEHVVAVDVGKGIFDWKLRNDDRVTLMEGVNARYLKPEDIDREVDLIVIDTSFISLTKIIPAVLPFLKQDGVLLPMVKPQFEAGKDLVPKGGVIRDAKVHSQVLRKISTFMYDAGMKIISISPSPIKGPKGNREFFIYARKSDVESNQESVDSMIHEAVYGEQTS